MKKLKKDAVTFIDNILYMRHQWLKLHPKKKKKGKFSKFWVTFIIILNTAFTVADLVVFYKTGAEPASLTVAWFAFTTGELWLLTRIKKAKIEKGDDNE